MQELINHYISCYTAEKLSVWKLTAQMLLLLLIPCVCVCVWYEFMSLGLEFHPCCEFLSVCICVSFVSVSVCVCHADKKARAQSSGVWGPITNGTTWSRCHGDPSTCACVSIISVSTSAAPTQVSVSARVHIQNVEICNLYLILQHAKLYRYSAKFLGRNPVIA